MMNIKDIIDTMPIKEDPSVYDKIDDFRDALFKMKDDRDFFGSKLDRERWETLTAVIELFGEFFLDKVY